MTEISKAASLTTEIMNPVVESTVELFDMMLGCPARRRELTLITGRAPLHPVSAFIGLSGLAVGSICVTLPRRTAFAAVYRMVEERCTEVNSLVVDTVGEFANIIAGNAKAKLDNMHLEMGLPNVVIGGNQLVGFPSGSNPMCLTFDSEIGPFSIIFGFIPKAT
ncbi:MAG: chemotaxis protein CheX [Planctomycetaceae bacterium]|nr:chemotaxis protein CheX [Planctomycetaceae bacterium]